MKIYLDACCLNRPFDDQTQDRIRLESEAVLLILGRIQAGQWEWLSSNVVDDEIEQTPDPKRRERMRFLVTHANDSFVLTDNDEDRMITQTMTLNQIQRTGLEVLSRELGPVGMIRFLQMFELGEGDYTAERHLWLDHQTVDDITKRIRQRQAMKKV